MSVDTHAVVLLKELGDPNANDDCRAELAASLLGVPKRRPQALAAIAPMLSERAYRTPSGPLLATLGENPGRTSTRNVAALAKTDSTPLFDQILKPPRRRWRCSPR